MKVLVSSVCASLLAFSIVGAGFALERAAKGEVYEPRTHITIPDTGDPIYRAFFQAFPKGGDLHMHLSGAVSIERILRLASDHGLCFERETYVLSKGPCTTDRVPLEVLYNDGFARSEFIQALSTRGIRARTPDPHERYFEIFQKIGAATEVLREELIEEVARSADKQNIIYVEMMMTCWSSFIKPVHDSIIGAKIYQSDFDESQFDKNWDKIKNIASVAVDDAIRATGAEESCGLLRGEPESYPMIRYIQQVRRNNDLKYVFAQLVFAFELANAGMQGRIPVVGFDLVGPEHHPIASGDYERHMAMITLLRKHYPNVRFALHAGELGPNITGYEDLYDHIEGARAAGASRIGHAVSIPFEKDANALIEKLIGGRVAVAVSLTSNDIILGVGGEYHPLGMLFRRGVPITLSTDNPGLNGSDLTNEYMRANAEHGLNHHDLKEISFNGIRSSLLPAEDKKRLEEELQRRFQLFEETWSTKSAQVK